jgi:hypothetical protein
MIHTDVTASWVYEHYLAYLFICIADVEAILSIEQLENVRKRVFKNFDSDRCSRLVQEVFREYRSHTESERKAYIRDNVSRFLRTDNIRQRVINELSSVTSPDEDNLGQVMFRYIRKTINLSR